MRLRKDMRLGDEDMLLVANVSDALAHPVRIKLYQYVMVCNKELKPVCNGDLVKEFGYSQATISQHMNKLTESGLVEKKKQDRYTMYYANIGMLRRFLDTTMKFSSFTR